MDSFTDEKGPLRADDQGTDFIQIPLTEQTCGRGVLELRI